ncbi:MAG TPA: TOMM precursor leader peptide-binding protein [Ktedonobacteraceae bacterium]|nr:TOMM precursor leader peptide-binding protein [Ktedonobacteraceae bacterium]
MATENLITVEATLTSSSLDESILRMKAYLVSRLASRKAHSHAESAIPAIHVSPMLIDIGALGLFIGPEAAPESWCHAIVYPIRIYHATVTLGPVYSSSAGYGPCPRCLERRFSAIRSKEEQEALDGLQQALIFGHNPWLTPYALESIWEVLAAVLDQYPVVAAATKGEAWLHSLNLKSLKLSKHLLIADSFCPFCSQPQSDTAEAATIHLMPRIKQEITDYRLVKPTEYGLPLAGYINPICGLLGPVAEAENLHTVTAPVSGKFFHKNLHSFERIWWGGHSTSFATSKYIGVLEGLERYTGHWARKKKVSVFDSYENLQPDALDPRQCGLYRPEYYQQVHPVYIPFTPEGNFSWVWGYSFGNARPILVPEQLAYYCDFREGYPLFVSECSNGCAIGSCMEEAILFGLLELIERDGFLISWYAKLAPPRIDPWSCHNPTILGLLDRIDRLGYDIHFLDTRLDTKMPTITAMALKREDSPGKLVLAAGAGLDPEDAIRGALCEVAAYIPSLAIRVNDELEAVRGMVQDFTKVTSLEHHPLIYGLPEMASQADFLLQNPKLSSVADAYAEWYTERPHTSNLLDDVQFCINEILKLGMDVIVIDQTCPEQERTGLKVARVIVPGLMPIDFGWGRQRVYELTRLRTVPRTSGFMTTDFDVAHLNTTPHPFP